MELNNVLLANTDGKAFEENIILSRNVRVSVLTPETLRVEYSTDGKFTDLPSQSIWYRNFGKVEFTHETKIDTLCVKTSYAEFYINSHSGSFKYVVIDGKKCTYNHENNLKGTTRTLDGTYGPTELKDGIISTDGVSVYYDSKTLLLNDDGICPKILKLSLLISFKKVLGKTNSVRPYILLEAQLVMYNSF